MTQKNISVSDAPVSDNTDRRIRKTRTSLKRALTQLMLKKNIKDISVKELTDMADINRGTFYLHYRDVFDLLSQLEDDLLQELVCSLDNCVLESMEVNLSELFTRIYRMCQENEDFVRILIGENGDIKFINKLRSMLRERCLKLWSLAQVEQNPEYFDACYAFVVGGCLNMIQYWFVSGMKETPEELALITNYFVNKNSQFVSISAKGTVRL